MIQINLFLECHRQIDLLRRSLGRFHYFFLQILMPTCYSGRLWTLERPYRAPGSRLKKPVLFFPKCIVIQGSRTASSDFLCAGVKIVGTDTSRIPKILKIKDVQNTFSTGRSYRMGLEIGAIERSRRVDSQAWSIFSQLVLEEKL